MSTKLGVLSHGPSLMGFPFHSLFDKVVSIEDVKQVKDVEAIVLWGGTDISPSLYNQMPCNFCESTEIPSKRDSFEWSVLKACVTHAVPVIGVCRGAQLMCAFDGGALAQDIAGHLHGHSVIDEEGVMFFAAANHHQMMLPKEGNRLLAWANKPPQDYYIGSNNTFNSLPRDFKEPEAVYFPRLRGVGFQFHPEWEEPHGMCVKWTLEKVKEFLL